MVSVEEASSYENNRPVKDWYRGKRDPIENGLQANGPIAGEGRDGYVDYDLEMVMIIPEPGAVIVNWLSIVNGFVPPPYDVLWYRIDAVGRATCTDAAEGPEGFNSGSTAEINYLDDSTRRRLGGAGVGWWRRWRLRRRRSCWSRWQ